MQPLRFLSLSFPPSFLPFSLILCSLLLSFSPSLYCCLSFDPSHRSAQTAEHEQQACSVNLFGEGLNSNIPPLPPTHIEHTHSLIITQEKCQDSKVKYKCVLILGPQIHSSSLSSKQMITHGYAAGFSLFLSGPQLAGDTLEERPG